MKALKRLSPESFGSLKEEFINQMMLDYGSRETKTGFKSGAFLDAIDKKYGKEFLSEVMNDGPGPDLNTVKKILTVTERIENMSKGISVDKMSEAQKKGLMDVVIGTVADIKFKQINGFSALFKSEKNVLKEIMTRDGIDKYVNSYPGKINKKATLDNLNDMLANWKVWQALGSGINRTAKRKTIDETREKVSPE